ncbi:MAG: hypothetical protein M0D55_18585 [Elusimicrobiota bacterium]|nr:MAG: hypothetical protein M0D55_18585 [Elusimicrobiota bacterium]
MPPEYRQVLDIFVFLGSVNGGFWLLARAASGFLDIFSELFWEDIWSLVATVYNVALAAFFAAILMAAARHGAAPADLYWRQACGFVMLYLALGAAYMDRSGRICEEGRLGYVLGLAAYILYAAVPSLVSDPRLHDLIGTMKRVSDSWVGRAMTAFVVGGILWKLAKDGLSGLFHVLAPVLWKAGALKHPPIRVRRED